MSRKLSREVLRKWSSTAEVRASIEQQRISFKNRSSIDPPGVKELSRRQELSRLIHQVSRRCRDCVKKKA